MMFHGYFVFDSLFQMSYRKSLESYKGVAEKFQERFKGVSRRF